MDWHLLGNGVVTFECALILAWFSRIGVKGLRKLPVPVLIAFLSLASGTSIVAQKTNGVNNIPPMPIPPRSVPVVETISEDDVARGWRVESVTTNETVSYEMPSNAVYVSNWHIHGARSSFGNNVIDFGSAGTPRPTSWTFPLGTNDEAFSSFWYFVDGRIRPRPKDTMREICAVGVPMSAVPGQSRLWSVADDDLRVLTWENFFLGGDTNAPVNAQIRLFANGDFTTRSNNVETVCRRVNPDDWDGDGLANEKDENPLVYDGDFFGVANAMPTNANLDAYYWLDVAAVGAFDFAPIRITCDGPSDLGDHVIIARTNQVCHVPLLAGATYTVESDLPIAYSAVSSEYAEIVTNAPTSLTVRLPVELSFGQIRMRSGSGSGDALTSSYALQSLPIDVGASLASVSGGCCLCETNALGFSWFCSENCRCGGEHWLSCVASWEGYSKAFNWYGSCSCAMDETEPSSLTGDGINLSIDMPSTFIANDDDDNDDGLVDATPPFWSSEDEVTTGRVSFAATMLTNGIVKLQKLTGLEQGTNGARRVYADASGNSPIDEGHEYIVENSALLEREFHVNPAVTSSHYKDGHVRVLWKPESGHRSAVGKSFTIVEPTVEPITDESWSLVDFAGDGRLHSYLYNPCAVVVGKTATFKVDVLPEDYPDSEIVWTTNMCEGAVRFVGSNVNTGRVVTVEGEAPGGLFFEIHIGDSQSFPPVFMVDVVEQSTVKLRTWIIGNGSQWPTDETKVSNMVAVANDIYSQVGIKIDLVGPIVKTNIPNAYNPTIEQVETNKWHIGQVVSIAEGTDGLECYFVNGFFDQPETVGVNCSSGMVLSAFADGVTLAHEIGHAFGLCDIFVSTESYTNDVVTLRTISSEERPMEVYMTADWNGGCKGHGTGGVRYYGKDVTHPEVIGRMLMNGCGGSGRDITFGRIHGIWCSGNVKLDEDWHVGLAPVGFLDNTVSTRSPVHQ